MWKDKNLKDLGVETNPSASHSEDFLKSCTDFALAATRAVSSRVLPWTWQLSSNQTLCSYSTSEHTLSASWHHEWQHQKRDRQQSAALHWATSPRLICLGLVPYQCGDTFSVPGETSFTASPDIWHRISDLYELIYEWQLSVHSSNFLYYLCVGWKLGKVNRRCR